MINKSCRTHGAEARPMRRLFSVFRPTEIETSPRGNLWPSLLAVMIVAFCVSIPVMWLAHYDDRSAASDLKLAPSLFAAAPTVPAASPRAAEDAWKGFVAQLPAPAELPTFAVAPAVSPLEESVLRLARNDTLTDLLAGLDIGRAEIARAISALRPHLDIRRLQVGQAVRVTLERSDEADVPVLQALTIRPEPLRQVTLERNDTGDYRATEKMFDVLKRVRHAAGLIRDSLIGSAQHAGLPQGALQEMLRAFAWDVSFQHDLKAGDRFAALFEQLRTEDGRLLGTGRLLWARLTTGGGKRSFSIYRFKPRTGREFFYTSRGESVVRALLRTPLDVARLTISSAFGKRRHPLLGFTRLHAGVDFAAPPGTPVLAAGDGRIVQAGRNGGYGNWVQIAHQGALSTGYAHMQRIARGIRRGVSVRQNQVIGFVGTTGLSTGPHLHFELRRGGTPVDPLSVAHRSLRTRLAGADLVRFKKTVAEIDRLRTADDSL